MTIQPAGPAGPAPEQAAGKADLHQVLSCPACGQRVTKVRTRVPGEWATLDGPDPAGEWWAARDNRTRQWRMVAPLPGEEPPVGNRRYRGHACEAEIRRAERVVTTVMGAAGPVGARAGGNRAAANDDMGRCTGGCGGVVVRCGPRAEPMCPPCRDVLEAWRALPGPHRGPILFGRRSPDGVYGPATKTHLKLAPNQVNR